MPKTAFLIASEHFGWSDVRHTLEALRDVRIAGQASQPARAYSAAVQLRPDLIIAETSPESAGTAAMIVQIARELPQAWFVLLADAFTYEELVSFSNVNVRGGLLWGGLTRAILSDFFMAILDGGTVLSSGVSSMYFHGNRPAAWSTSLTPREREVLGLLVRGLSDQEIADQLGISANTIPSHVHRIEAKLGARNRSHLCYIAGKGGLS